MSAWRGWILAVLTVTVAIAGIVLFVDVNAAANGEVDDDDEEGSLAAPPEGVRTERITPPGAPPPRRPPPSRLRPSSTPPSPPTPAPTFRLGGIPPIPGQEDVEKSDDELQRQLAERRLAALERRVRAMNRRIQSMGEREADPERIDSQKQRMDSLLEEVQEKRREMGMPPFDPDGND